MIIRCTCGALLLLQTNCIFGCHHSQSRMVLGKTLETTDPNLPFYSKENGGLGRSHNQFKALLGLEMKFFRALAVEYFFLSGYVYYRRYYLRNGKFVRTSESYARRTPQSALCVTVHHQRVWGHRK